MNVLYDFVPQAMFERIGWALFHSLWQATAIAVLLAVALLLLRRRSANVRYVTALVALLLMVIVLPITVALVPDDSERVTSVELEDSDSVAEVTTSAAAVENAIAAPRPTGAADPQAVGEGPSQSVGLNKGTEIVPAESFSTEPSEAPLVVAPALDSPETLADETTLQHLARLIQPGLPWAAGSWIGGIVLVSLWHLGGWCSLRRLRSCGVHAVSQDVNQRFARLCRAIVISRPVELLESARVTVPLLLGMFRPVILLPGSVVTGLTPQQLEAILLHELAHVRRHDYLLNLLQTAAETLLFYHPAVWWISRRIRIERENCCDDLVLAVTSDRLLYAQSLTRLEELRQQTAAPRPAALTLAASGGSLLDRISRVLGAPRRSARSRASAVGMTGLSGLLTIAAALLFLLPGVMSPAPAVSADAAVAPGDGDVPSTRPDEAQVPRGATTKAAVAEDPKPAAKPIDLGNARLRIETQPVDKNPPKLYAVGSYHIFDLPTAKDVYQWRLERKVKDGYREVVGRMPGKYDPGARFEVERFERVGGRITAVIKHIGSEADVAGPQKAVYVRAFVPVLPPGQYTVQISFRDYIGNGDRIVPSKKTRDPISCKFDVPAGDPVAAELKKLAQAAIAIKPSVGFTGKTLQNPTGVDLSRIVKLTRGADLWQQCVKLNDDNVDVKIRAAQALAKLADPASAAVLLAAAKNNHHFVPGSESATVHSVYRGTLKTALEKSTGLSLTPKGLRFTTPGPSGKLREWRSDDNPEAFPEQVDFGKVDVWLRVMYLLDVEPTAKDEGKSKTIKAIKSPKDRGTLRDAILGRPVCVVAGRMIDGGEIAKSAVPRSSIDVTQTIEVTDVLAGFKLKGRIPLRYTRSQSNRPPGKGERVICVLQSRFDGYWNAALVLVDTSQARAAIKTFAPERTKKDAAQTRRWVERLSQKKIAGSFNFSIEYRGDDRATAFHSLLIRDYPGWDERRQGHPAVTIDPAQRKTLIMHLASESFLLRALSDLGKDVPPPRTPSYTFRLIADGGKVSLFEVVGWGPSAIERLRKLRTALKGDAATEIDKLLAKLPDAPKERVSAPAAPPSPDPLFPNPKRPGPPVQKPEPQGVATTDLAAAMVLKQVKARKDRGTLRDAYEKVRLGGAPGSKRDTLLVVPGPKPKEQTPSAWFNGWLKADYVLTADQENWLLYRSQQLDDADVEWIERVERQGNEFIVTANRAIWSGDLKKNITFHNVFGINLGKLPAGEYTVKWIIRESSFFEIDKDRWPKDAKASKQKPVALKTSFTVLPALKVVPKSPPDRPVTPAKPENPNPDRSVPEDPKPEKPKRLEPKRPDPAPLPKSIQYFEGKTDKERTDATIRWLHHKLKSDAIVVATPAIGGSDELIVETQYIIQHVLKGEKFLKQHVKKRDLGGELGKQSLVLVQTVQPFKTNTALSQPDGPVVLFLKGPQGDSKSLTLNDTHRANDGMVYATKEVVGNTVECLTRFQRLLAYFKANGFPLEERGRAFVIDKTADGATANTSFFVFSANRDGNEIINRLLHINLAMMYNPYCQIAMAYPGISGPPNTPDGWKSPKRLAQYMASDSRFVKLFREYRPKGAENSPKKSDIERHTRQNIRRVLDHFAIQGIKLKLLGTKRSPPHKYFVAEPATEGYQILVGVWVYPPQYSRREIEKDLLQYGVGGPYLRSPAYTLNQNYVLWAAYSTVWQLKPEQRKKESAKIDRITKQIVDAFQRMKPPAEKGKAGRPASGKTSADDRSLRSEMIKRAIERLRHPNEHTRRNAADSLARFGPDAKPAVDELIRALSNKTDDELRMYAARALGAIGPDSRKAVPALRRALSDRESFGSRFVRKEAAKALGLIGPEAAGGAVTGLIALLGDDDLYVRRAASQSLGLLGNKAIPDLVRSLGHQNPEIRYRATTALARMRDTAREALEKALESDHVRVRRGAARAFASYYVLPQYQSVAKLSEHLQDNDPEVRRWIIIALTGCIVQSDDALKALLAELKNDNAASFEVVVLLSRTVSREKVLHKVLKALEDDHPTVIRSQLMCAIGLAGPSARKAVPKLKEALKDSRVALRAAEALFRIAPKDKDVQRAVEAYFAKHKLDGLYPGYLDDVRLVARNMDYEGPGFNFSTPEAIRAGRRVFANVDFKGKTKQEVLAILGDPKALSAYARGRCKDIEGKLVYCFATGIGGWEYTLLFKDGRVVSVTPQGLN